MTHTTVTLAILSSVLLFGSATAYAESETSQRKQRVETPAPQMKSPTLVAFSQGGAQQPQAQMPDLSQLDDDLQSDGTQFGWIDADGTPLILTREKDEILVRRQNGPTSRLKLTDMSGVIEPQIGTSAVVTAK